MTQESPQTTATPGPRRGSLLVASASLVIVVAGLKLAGPILMPMLVALFLAMVTHPIACSLRKRGFSKAFSITTVVFGVILLIAGLGWLIGDSAERFAAVMPEHIDRIGESLALWAESRNLPLADIDITSGIRGPFLQAVTGTAREVAAAVSNILLTVLLMLFLLLEADSFPAKVKRIVFGEEQKERLGQMAEFQRDLGEYLIVKTIVSLATGLLLGAWVWILGVDFAFLLGVIALLFNFIPTFGSILAGIPAVLLAIVQFGLLKAGLVATGYVVVNVVIGSILEPQIMGRRVGLSPVVVFISVVFWGWVWGPTGMLLSVPLTMAGRIYCDHSPSLKWLAVMLGNESNGVSSKVEAPEAAPS